MSYTATIIISILSLIVLFETLYIFRRRKPKDLHVTETQKIIADVRKTLRTNHKDQRKLYSDLDKVMADVSLYLSERGQGK